MYACPCPIITATVTCRDATASTTPSFGQFPWGLILVMGLFLGSAADARGEFTHEVETIVGGQEVVWAKPLDAGPIRVLFIAPRFTLGDVAHLAARLDMEYETVALWDTHNIGYDPMAFTSLPMGGSREDTLKRIRNKLKQRLDVIVLANFDTDILPEKLFSDILDKVADGVGLVIVHPQNNVDSPLHLVLDALTPAENGFPIGHGVGACAFPGGLPHDAFVQQLIHGDGRVVALAYMGDSPRNHGLIQTPSDPLDVMPFYENNAYSLVSRALCIAARRLDGVRISSVQDAAPRGPAEDEIPPDFEPEFVQAMRDSVVGQHSRPFRLTLSKPADRRYSVSAQLRRVDSDVLISWHDPAHIPRGADAYQFEIPVGPGAYTVDVWLHGRSGIVDWYSKDVILPGWPEFRDLELEKTWLYPNDSLELSLEVRPVVSHTRSGTLYARAMDGYGRMVSEAASEFSHDGGRMRLRLHFADLISALIKLEVFSLEGSRRSFSEWELHSAYREVRYLSVRQRQAPHSLEIVVSTDTPPYEYGMLHYFRSLSQHGIHWLHAPAGEATIVRAAQQHLRLLPQVDAAARGEVDAEMRRVPCLNDPGFRAENQQLLQETTLRHWAGGFGRYSLGNGSAMSATSPWVCQCRHCIIKFQETLENSYGDLTTLNAAWETSFPDWDFVVLPAAFGPGESDIVAPWLDFRRYTDHSFAAYHRWARQVAQHADSNAFVGARFGSDTQPTRGYHWPTLFASLDFVAAPYSPLMAAKVRSYSAHDSFSGVTIENAYSLGTPEMHRWFPWRLALDGLQTVWLDTPFGDSRNPAPDAWLSPDGAATPALRALTEATARLGDTVGPLLYAAAPTPPSVAVYDSHASRHLADVDALYTASLAEAQQTAVDILQLAGYPFVFIDKARLLEPASTSYQVIVLAGARALDEEEGAALRRFVAGGGALIADVVPGDCDEHGVLRRDYVLGDLFGVHIDGPPRPVPGLLTIKATNTDGKSEAGAALVNASVTLEGGIALAAVDETSAWIVSRQGEGHTFLLNHPFRAIERDQGRRLVPREFHAITTFMDDLPDMAPHDKDADFLGTVRRYDFGKTRIYAVLPDYDAPWQSIRLPLKRDAIVYNALTGDRVRRPHRARFRLAGGEPLIVTVLPEAITDLYVETPEHIHQGQRLPIHIVVQTSAGRADDHLCLVDLIPPRDAPIPWYRQLVNIQGGVGATFIPLALNDTLGNYTLRVRDALTGMETVTPIALSSPVN